MSKFTFDDGTSVWLGEIDPFSVDTKLVAEIVGEEEPDDIELVGRAIFGPQEERVLIIERKLADKEQIKQESMFDKDSENKRVISFEELSRRAGAWNEDSEAATKAAEEEKKASQHHAKIKLGKIYRTKHRGVFEKSYLTEDIEISADTNVEMVEKMSLAILRKRAQDYDVLDINLSVPKNEHVETYSVSTDTEDPQKLKEEIIKKAIADYKDEIGRLEEALESTDDTACCGGDCGCDTGEDEIVVDVELDDDTEEEYFKESGRYYFSLVYDTTRQKTTAMVTDAEYFDQHKYMSDWNLEPVLYNWDQVSEGVYAWLGSDDIKLAFDDISKEFDRSDDFDKFIESGIDTSFQTMYTQLQQ